MTFSDLFGFLGYSGLMCGFLCCVFIIFLSVILLKQHHQIVLSATCILTHLQTLLLGISVLSLAVLLQLNAFEYQLVFKTVEVSMPWFQKLSGLWVGQSSSILFWSFIMSANASLSIKISKKIPHTIYTPAVLFILEFILVFFIIPDVFFINPYAKTWMLSNGSFIWSFFPPINATLFVPVDGLGLNPSLRHIAMQLHPPFIYLGLIGFFIPYAFALTSLWKDNRDSKWVKLTYPIVLAAWLFLTIGMVLGSWWAYTILGWGGYWGWDAVEISGLLPWILSSGLVHSMGMQLRGYPFKRWIYTLTFMITLLIFFGILLTRSGIIESVHAYARGAMGPILTVLIAINIFIVIFLLIKRWKTLGEKAKQDKKSYAFLLVCFFNMILVALVAIYLFGQTLPLTSQLIHGEKSSFTSEQYKFISAPLLLLMVLVTALFPIAHLKDSDQKKFKSILNWLIFISAVCPLLLLFFSRASVLTAVGFWAAAFVFSSWLYAFWANFLIPFTCKKRNKERIAQVCRLGPILIHLGFAIMCIGILGVENLSSHHDIQLGVGDAVSVGSDLLIGQSHHYYTTNTGRVKYKFTVILSESNGVSNRFIPFIEYYPKVDTFYSEPAVHMNLWRDVQVVMSQRPSTSDGKAYLRVYIFPLMSWIWAGGAMMIFGGACACVQKNKDG